MSHVNRIEGIGRIRRGRAVRFYYDGRQYFGYEGDTLASALLANGVHLTGRSFKYHRPRGIFTAGSEEPNAIVQLESGAYTEPNTRVTQVELYEGLRANSQNCWPSVKYDIGAVNSLLSRFLPAGFYYKTFMWPASMWMTYEHFIRNAAGLGKSPEQKDPDRYEQLHAHCDVLVAGGGPAGLSAALAAAKTGASVIIMDEQSEMGGSLLASDETIDGVTAAQWLRTTLETLGTYDNVTVVPRCTVTGYFDYNYLTAAERVTDHLGIGNGGHLPRQRFWKIRAKRVVIAAGAIERPLLFKDNDRPGVMLANAVRTYIRRYCVLPAKSVCVFTNNDSAYDTAIAVHEAGGAVTVVDTRQSASAVSVKRARDAGITVYHGYAVSKVIGSRAIRRVEIRRLSDDAQSLVGDPVTVNAQVIANGGGWNPVVNLFSQSRGKLRFESGIQAFVPDKAVAINPSVSAGSCAGVYDTAQCLATGAEAGEIAARAAASNSTPAVPMPQLTPALAADAVNGRDFYVVPANTGAAEGLLQKWNDRGYSKHFHDLQNDVTVADIHLAATEGYQSVEHLKRYTTTGMGTDQGKTSNVNALSIMASIQQTDIPSVGTTTFRPPYTPVTFGAITGQNRGELFLQARKTPMHAWHELNNAVFEDVGDWKRPWYFPRHGETMHQAVDREALATRQSVGMVDASTLGKIDIQGADAAWFLNMVYTNAWLKLPVGHCRYGLMLNEHGMVFDDGVTTRLGENHFHMTTTTGGAARVMAWLEEWLQTEWPEREVYCTSVTEQWAVAAINGPNARALLESLTDEDLSDESFPHMSYKSMKVAGLDARVFRISFTGELSFEINVSARHGLALWEALIDAGKAFDLTVYGTETMHVLRAEKGFIIVGQDTDGTVTPFDLGMSWIVNKNKPDFLGKRSLSRTHTAASRRRQLVGLLTDDPDTVLPEGAHLVEGHVRRVPAVTQGHVTSSYMSPNAKRSIAMGLVTNGLDRLGESLTAQLMDGQMIGVTLVKPDFLSIDKSPETKPEKGQ